MTQVLTRDDVRRAVESVLDGYGLTLGQFIAAGEADELEADELRDLWLMNKGVFAP